MSANALQDRYVFNIAIGVLIFVIYALHNFFSRTPSPHK